MGKFTHLTEDEIVSHVEKYGTDDEREIMDKVRPILDYEECPYCAKNEEESNEANKIISTLKSKIETAIEALS